MKPATDPTVDYKAVVQRGFDLCAPAYEEGRRRTTQPQLELLIGRLPEGGHILDIGCGAGVPIAQTLARRYQVTGVDLSRQQIRRAQGNVPTGRFLQSDIMAASFPPACFDAVVAFCVIFHLPREEHPELFRRIRSWLRPGGYLLATLSSFSEEAYTEDDFFGVTMYWSNYGLDDYKAILTQTGFKLRETTSTRHGYAEGEEVPAEHFPVVLAQAA